MKNVFLILLMTIVAFISISAQNDSILKRVLLTNSYGEPTFLKFNEKNGPTVFVVYGPGCGICIKELNVISEKIETWEKLYNVELVAFSRKYKRDYSRQITKLKEKQGYKFSLYIDTNGDLADYLFNVSGIDTTSFSRINGLHLMIPQTVILSEDQKVVFQKHGYQTGDEDQIEAILKEL